MKKCTYCISCALEGEGARSHGTTSIFGSGTVPRHCGRVVFQKNDFLQVVALNCNQTLTATFVVAESGGSKRNQMVKIQVSDGESLYSQRPY